MTLKDYIKKTALMHLVATSIIAAPFIGGINGIVNEFKLSAYKKNNPRVVKAVQLKDKISTLKENNLHDDLYEESEYYFNLVNHYNDLIGDSKIKSGLKRLDSLETKSLAGMALFLYSVIPATIAICLEEGHISDSYHNYKDKRGLWR